MPFNTAERQKEGLESSTLIGETKQKEGGSGEKQVGH